MKRDVFIKLFIKLFHHLYLLEISPFVPLGEFTFVLYKCKLSKWPVDIDLEFKNFLTTLLAGNQTIHLKSVQPLESDKAEL
jgi:hypothetical protein